MSDHNNFLSVSYFNLFLLSQIADMISVPSGGHQPRDADEGGGASRFSFPRHDPGQLLPAALCGRCFMERSELCYFYCAKIFDMSHVSNSRAKRGNLEPSRFQVT